MKSLRCNLIGTWHRGKQGTIQTYSNWYKHIQTGTNIFKSVQKYLQSKHPHFFTLVTLSHMILSLQTSSMFFQIFSHDLVATDQFKRFKCLADVFRSYKLIERSCSLRLGAIGQSCSCRCSEGGAHKGR